MLLCVVYEDYVKVSFLVGKCKIAPPRETLTIPKLELIAACLSVRFVQKVLSELHLEIHRTVYWIDPASVANRLSFIHHYSKPSDWRFRPTQFNVADVGTRVLLPSSIERLSPWIEGPESLRQVNGDLPSFAYKTSPVASSFLCLPVGVRASNVSTTLEDLILRYSSFVKLLRAVAIFSRFKGYLKESRKVSSSQVTKTDLDNARGDLCRFVQTACFGFLFDFLTGKAVSREHRNELNSLKKLSPFIDEEGLIRAGGRLQRSTLGYALSIRFCYPSVTIW